MPISERINGPEIKRPNTEHLHNNPDQLMTPEMQRWLSRAHIAILSTLWLPISRDGQTYGGTEAVVNNLIKTLNRFGVGQLTIFGHPANKELEQTIKSARVITPKGFDPNLDYYNILQTDKERANKLEQRYVGQAYEQIMEEKDSITIVHDHTNIGRRHGLAAADRISVVRTEHGPLTWPNTSHEEEATLREFIGQEKMGFFAISKNQRSQMPELNWVNVNYNGVEPSEFEFRKDKDEYVIYLGRIAEAKGVHNAIEITRRAGIQLVIAGKAEGTPESQRYFNERIKPKIDGKNVIHLKEGVNPEERKDWLSRATALMMPIEWEEPFGMNMAESLMSGTPIVAFNRGSVSEIVDHGKTGYIAQNIPDAVKGLHEIIEGNFDPAECRRQAEKKFSSIAMTAGYTRNYMNVVSKRENFN